MKSILISVKPIYARLIEAGYKLEEIRKSVPKGFIGWVYLYETIGKKKWVTDEKWGNEYPFWIGYEIYNNAYLPKRLITEGRGKIIGRWWHDSYQTIPYEVTLPQGYENHDGEWIDYSLYGYWVNTTLLERSFLTDKDISLYGNGKTLYAWKIDTFEKLDLYLSDFMTWNKGDKWTPDMNWIELKRPPQSWQYVYVKENEDE